MGKKEVAEVDWKGTLEKNSGFANIVPLINKASRSRVQMGQSMLKQSIPPIKADIPIVMSSVAKDLLRSSEQHKLDGDIEVLEIVEKTIFGKKCNSTFVLFEKDGELDYMELNEYFETSESYAERLDMSTIKKDSYRKGEMLVQPASFNDSGFYSYGTNLNAIFATGLDVLEDQILIADDAGADMKVNKIATISINIDAHSSVLKNIYGDGDTYKPFPLIGESLRDDSILIAMTKDNKYSFLLSNSLMGKIAQQDDIAIVPFKHGKVIDIDVKLPKDGATNSFLNDIREENMLYEDAKMEAINRHLSDYAMTSNIHYKYEELKIIRKSLWKDGEREFKNSAIVTITVLAEKAVSVSQKLTGAFGNKGVVGRIMSTDVKAVPRDKMPVSSDGRRIDIVFNTLSLVNRNIIGQLCSLHMANVSWQMGEALKKMDITHKDKFDIIHTVTSMYSENNATGIYRVMEKVGVVEYVDYVLNEDRIRFIIRPMSNSLTLKVFGEVKEYLRSVGITVGDVTISNEFGKLFDTEIGEIYIQFMKQSNESASNCSIRTKGSFTDKGDPTKTRAFKDNKTRYADTPIKLSGVDTYLCLHLLDECAVNSMLNRSDNTIRETYRNVTTVLGYVVAPKDSDVYEALSPTQDFSGDDDDNI